LSDEKIAPYNGLPYGVEDSVREGNGKRILFLMNQTEEVKRVPVPSGKKNLLTGATTGDVVELGRFDVAVIIL
jgi:beta-galactosidase